MGVILLKLLYTNSQSTPQKVGYLGAYWGITLIRIDQITQELQTTVTIFSTLLR